MAISMTGFGAAKVERDQWTCTVEARSVNHRHLDLNARLPPAFTTLEGDLKKWVGDYCRRGRVDLTLNLERAQGGEGDLALDGRLALAYGAVVKEFERLTGVPVQVGLSDLLKVKDLVRAPEPPAGETFFAAMAEEATRAAMAGLRDMRRREGEALLVDIKRRLLQCGGMVGEIGKHAVDIKAAQYRRLKDNLAELEGKVAVAEDRLAQEVALYAERCDITEELTRFRAHLDHIDEMFADEEVGKRADFLLQELFREINTIASKANMAEIRHIVVEVKGELEKVREQVQNLE